MRGPSALNIHQGIELHLIKNTNTLIYEKGVSYAAVVHIENIY